MIGEMIAHYRILEKLGSGGMGVVYRAEDTRLGREVALKLLPDQFSRDDDAIERFKREARAASTLSHPHICTVHDVGEHAGRHFIVMELLEGTALDERVAGRPLPAAQLLRIGSEIADALETAHTHGLVHRDVKPGNIFLSQRGTAKLLDFGIAKSNPRASLTSAAKITEASLTTPGMFVGTVAYMSPEQVRGESLDARTDLFSLGVVLYEMATGRLAFDGNTTGVIHEAILNRTPTPVRQLNPEVPPKLEEIINRALEKDRDLRYQTASDLRADLQRLSRDTVFATDASLHPTVPDLKGQAGWRPRTAAIGAFALATAILAAWLLMARARGTTIDSVAVLPFVNSAADVDTDYLSDGIAESLINNLSQLPNVRVTARSAAFRYKGKDTDPQQIGRELRVQAVVSGRVLQRADTLIVRAEMIDVADGSQLWGDQYDRKVADVLALQDELSTQIAEKLRVRLSGAEKLQLTKRYTRDAEAYQFYLKGRYHLYKPDPDSVQKALEQFRGAVNKDPAFALAYAGISESYNRMSFLNVLTPHNAMPQAKAAAATALQIDEQVTEAHMTLGYASFTYDWDWAAAAKHYARAESLDRAAVMNHPLYPFYLTSAGRSSEAIAVAKAALDQDPASAGLSHTLTVQLGLAGQLDAAIAECRRTLELDSNLGIAHEVLAGLYSAKGVAPEALAAAERAVALSPGNLVSVAVLGHVRARFGDRPGALRILDQLTETAKHRYTPAVSFAIVYVGLGDKDQAFAWLDKAYNERINRLAYIRREPIWNSLRSDPRFDDLIRRIGAPQ
jgi:eukaryotic-like serine/threonine-protein kinase